jgi:hypothetical protein
MAEVTRRLRSARRGTADVIDLRAGNNSARLTFVQQVVNAGGQGRARAVGSPSEWQAIVGT